MADSSLGLDSACVIEPPVKLHSMEKEQKLRGIWLYEPATASIFQGGKLKKIPRGKNAIKRDSGMNRSQGKARKRRGRGGQQ